MGRITIALNERDHLALKLLALQKDEKLVTLLNLALQEYLKKTGAYDLAIKSTNP